MVLRCPAWLPALFLPQMGCREGLPEEVAPELLEDEGFQKTFHHALLEVGSHAVAGITKVQRKRVLGGATRVARAVTRHARCWRRVQVRRGISCNVALHARGGKCRTHLRRTVHGYGRKVGRALTRKPGLASRCGGLERRRW